MKIYFKEEHILLKDMVKEFAINEIRPNAKVVDSGIFPQENINKMADWPIGDRISIKGGYGPLFYLVLNSGLTFDPPISKATFH